MNPADSKYTESATKYHEYFNTIGYITITETLCYMPESRGSILDEFMEIFIDLILPSALWSWDRLDRQANHFPVPMF